MPVEPAWMLHHANPIKWGRVLFESNLAATHVLGLPMLLAMNRPTDGVQPFLGCTETVAEALEVWTCNQLQEQQVRTARSLFQRCLTPELSRAAKRRRLERIVRARLAYEPTRCK